MGEPGGTTGAGGEPAAEPSGDDRGLPRLQGMREGLRLRRPEDFDLAYEGTPPWETGRPQSALRALAEGGALRGRVLDVGCGTGEHALLAASLGLEVTGIDVAAAAIERARQKADQRGLEARFVVGSVLDLPALGGQFDTVLDSGLLHVLEDDDRSAYLEGLRSVVPAGGRYFLLCFSDRQPGGFGPRRMSQDEIRAAFADGWRVDSIEPVMIDTVFQRGAVHAWLASITRI
jgi:cyclopropane fatty-acyl-phospholipid synthase-like methyltransferase